MDKYIVSAGLFFMLVLTPSSCTSPRVSEELVYKQTPVIISAETEYLLPEQEPREPQPQEQDQPDQDQPDQDQPDQDQQTLVFPDYANKNPADLLSYLDSLAMNNAFKIVITDSFVQEFNRFQDSYFGNLYSDQEEPDIIIKDVLSFMEGCVGGNYLFGAQGNLVTVSFIENVSDAHPDYMDSGRKGYFLQISNRFDVDSLIHFPTYPNDYAWDCSGLWWDCMNTLSLFDEYTDRTAQQTFDDYCTPIKRGELQPGDLVFYRNGEDRITHMGIFGEKGYIYEAASGFVGVVKQRSLNARIYKDLVRGGYLVFPDWNEYGRPLIYD